MGRNNSNTTFVDASSREILQDIHLERALRYVSSLADEQLHIVSRDILRQANNTNSFVNIDLLFRVLKELESRNRLEYPFFPAYNVGSKERIDLDKHNENIRFLNADIETIRTAVGMIDRYIERIDRTINRSTKMLLTSIGFLDQKFREFRSQVGLAKYTFREDMSNTANFNLELTTANVDTDRRIIEAKTANVANGNISFGELTAENIQAVTKDNRPLSIDKNFYRLFIPGNVNTAVLQMIKSERSTTEVAVIARFNEVQNFRINTLVIDFANKVPTTIRIDLDNAGNQTTVVRDVIVLDSVYTFTFPEQDVEKITLRMSQNTETALSTSGRKAFQFRTNYIRPKMQLFSNDVEFVSNAISTDFPITDLSLEVSEQKPEGTDIEYFVSKNGVDFLPITPRNTDPDAANKIINISSRASVTPDVILPPDNGWNTLEPIIDIGNVPLYNILSYSTIPEVDNGVLAIKDSSTEEIIPESIKVYRGYDDYSIQTTKFETQQNQDDVLYRIKEPTIDENRDADDYTSDEVKTDAFVRIDAELHTTDDTGSIVVNYPIVNNNITVISVDEESKVEIVNYTNKTIQLNNISTGTRVIVTYHTRIVDIEEQDNVEIIIDPASVSYRFTLSTPEKTNVSDASDVYFNKYDKRFYVNINAAVPLSKENKYTFYASFKYTRRTKEVSKVYRSYVYYEEDTEIDIFPFTEDEIFAGNFHIIDGVNLSRATSHLLQGGLHEVITTQAFKTDPSNPNDVNDLTNKTSNAGIDLGIYSYRRAYKNPMRKVDERVLSNVVGPKNRETFAYNTENGKLLFNFIPEYLPENAETAATELTGDNLLLKDVEYIEDGKNTFKKYIRKDEQILLEYETRPKAGSENDIREVYIKGKLTTNKKKGVSPRIFKYDVLFF